MVAYIFVIPALMQADLCEGGQPGLQSQLQDSQSCYTEISCPENNDPISKYMGLHCRLPSAFVRTRVKWWRLSMFPLP